MNEQDTRNYVLSFEDIRQFYKSYKWKSFRAAVMRRKKYRCEKCWAKGKYKRAKVLHHIKHLREYPELALTESNMQALCKDCHREEHPEEYRKSKFEERWD